MSASSFILDTTILSSHNYSTELHKNICSLLYLKFRRKYHISVLCVLLLTCCSREFFSPLVSHNWVWWGEEWVEHWLWYISTTILTTLLQHHHHDKSAAHWTSKLCYINKIGKMQMPSKQISLYINWICLQRRINHVKWCLYAYSYSYFCRAFFVFMIFSSVN